MAAANVSIVESVITGEVGGSDVFPLLTFGRDRLRERAMAPSHDMCNWSQKVLQTHRNGSRGRYPMNTRAFVPLSVRVYLANCLCCRTSLHIKCGLQRREASETDPNIQSPRTQCCVALFLRFCLS